MLGRGFLPFAAIAAAAAIVGTSAAATGRPAVQTGVEATPRPSIVQYLDTLGIPARGDRVVVQRGMHNYVGTKCPGITWTCTAPAKDKIVVQFAKNDASNQVNCSASYPSGGSQSQNGADQECTVVQVASDGSSNDAQCVERTTMTVGVTQECTIEQVSTTGDNHAQVMQQVSSNGGPAQDATQTANVSQQSGSGKNDARVQQSINQNTNDVDPSGAQSQEGRQTLAIGQQSDTGDNHADAQQSLHQNGNIAPLGGKKPPLQPIAQGQNATDNGSPNLNGAIYQDSTSGNLDAHLDQSIDENVNAPNKNVSGSQTQGSPDGGLNGHFDQASSGVANAHGTQHEHQNMPQNPLLTQQQFDPAWMGSPQGSNPNDQYDIDQHVDQHAGKNAGQNAQIFTNCDSTGDCSGHEEANQNGVHGSNSCDSSPCHIATSCTSGPSGGGGGGGGLAAAASSTGSCVPTNCDGAPCGEGPPPPPPNPLDSCVDDYCSGVTASPATTPNG